ncbi:Proline--tRNA ligase [Planctomycetales bacterium 10988]|nr:Proline--tRNA ligase [Planctomycetales bacterium 10988]
MAKAPKTAIEPTREQDYPEWFQQVIKAAELAELSPVRGCMVIKPWGYALWENIQQVLDRMFKETGHVNAYFPLFIPMSYLEKEAEHVEGFAKECAVVTHHRLEPSPDGGLQPAGKLEEPLIVRPTSETIIGEMFSRWVQSYRDLPILINQWANVVRWEMRTRMFLRTAEFLWQEGHTAHATEAEAREETETMLKVYADFAENWMAMPVIQGEKTEGERFPGAVATYCIEAMMQDRKALQAGTSHFLGQNFAKAQKIQYLSDQGEETYAWTTSWGVSTRLIGAMIMTHSDDDGLVLPPKLAPKHVVILPIYKDDSREAILNYCNEIAEALRKQLFANRTIEVEIDDRDLRGGEKVWQHIKKGVPIRLEIGPRDMEKDAVFMGRRDKGPKEKQTLSRSDFIDQAVSILEEMQDNLYQRALEFREDNTKTIEDKETFKAYFTPKNKKKPEIHGGFARAYYVDDPELETFLKELKVTIRCLPFEEETKPGRCFFTGKETSQVAIFAKAY